jgi:hypothetical protein
VIVGLVFWLVMFVILRADKHERRAFAKIEAEERAKLASAQHEPTGTSATHR